MVFQRWHYRLRNKGGITLPSARYWVLEEATYTGDDDIVYQYRHCPGLNGIKIVAIRGDFLDRARDDGGNARNNLSSEFPANISHWIFARSLIRRFFKDSNLCLL